MRSPALGRFVVEAGFLVTVAVVIGLAELSPPWIVAIMGGAWLLTAVVETIAERAERAAVSALYAPAPPAQHAAAHAPPAPVEPAPAPLEPWPGEGVVHEAPLTSVLLAPEPAPEWLADAAPLGIGVRADAAPADEAAVADSWPPEPVVESDDAAVPEPVPVGVLEPVAESQPEPEPEPAPEPARRPAAPVRAGTRRPLKLAAKRGRPHRRVVPPAAPEPLQARRRRMTDRIRWRPSRLRRRLFGAKTRVQEPGRGSGGTVRA